MSMRRDFEEDFFHWLEELEEKYENYLEEECSCKDDNHCGHMSLELFIWEENEATA